VKIIDVDQGSEAWHAVRGRFATASCFADVLSTIKSGEAAARRNYRLKLVVQRLTGKIISTYQSPAMQLGIELEPVARSEYEAQTGNLVHRVGFIYDEMHEAGCSPDGLVGEDGGIEIKCPELAAHLESIRSPREPSIYTAQIQGSLWLSGRKWWDFVSYHPDFPANLQLVIRRIERDEQYITGLQLAVALFMREVREEEAALRALPIAA
jgi:predicted phage-related endonuclease